MRTANHKAGQHDLAVVIAQLSCLWCHVQYLPAAGLVKTTQHPPQLLQHSVSVYLLSVQML